MTRRAVRSLLGLVIMGFTLASCPVRAALLSGPADAVLGSPQRTVLVAEADRTVVQITFPVVRAPGDWQAAQRLEWQGIVTEDSSPGLDEIVYLEPQTGFQVALAERQLPAWRVATVQWYRPPVDPGAAVVTVSGPAVYRGVPLAQVTVHTEAGGGVLAGVVVEISHPAGKSRAPDPALQRRADRQPLPRSVVNPAAYRDFSVRAMSRPAPAKALPLPDYFGLTSNWVKLRLTEAGVYALTGSELVPMGVLLAGIDPTTLRLYKGGGLALDENPEVTDDEQPDRVGLTEVAITVEDGGDGEFNDTDRILFYGFGTDVWLDRLEPSGRPLDFYNHPHQSHGIYWLTYEDIGTPSPLPGAPRRVAAQAAPPTGAEVIDSFRARYHGESNLVAAAGFIRDNWVWDATIIANFNRVFFLEGVVAGQTADWNFDVAAASYTVGNSSAAPYQTRSWLNDDSDNPVEYSWRYSDQQNVERIRIEGSTTDVRNGVNRVNFLYDNYQDTRRAPLGFDSFDVRYTASLDKREYAGALTCEFWADEVTEPATANDLRFTLPATGAATLWDVSRPDSVFALVGDETAGDPRTLAVGIVRELNETRHLILFDDSDLLSIVDGRAVNITPLRQTVPTADYIVVHPAEYGAAAAALADLRSQHLPGVPAPIAVAVSVEDIYANFSGGQKDWRAIRQFLRWHTLTYNQRLRWVCLLGDASRDYRNYLDHDPRTELFDRVPTSLTVRFPPTSLLHPNVRWWPYVADEAMGSLDAPPEFERFDIPDLAMGRLPANNATEALRLVNQTRDFVTDLPAGSWPNEVAWAADDLYQGDSGGQYVHTNQAEILAHEYLPRSVDIDKIYLLDFPKVGIYKPAAHRALMAELNEGTSIFYYVGHGSPELLADEQLFRIGDIASLTNGPRRFFFMAFSCDVGLFANPFTQCMGEDFITATQGGAIVTVTASWVSYSNANDALSNSYCAELYPGRHVDPGSTVGEVLIFAKADQYDSDSTFENARRYNVLGDPALHIPNPVDDIRFTGATADSLRTGRLHGLQVDLSAVDLEPGPATTYNLRVQESGVEELYFTRYNGDEFYWRRFGNDTFRGNGTILDEDTVIPFLAPLNLRTGPFGRFRCIVNDGDVDHVAYNDVEVAQVAAATDDITGPTIDLTFPNGRNRVRPGEALTAVLHDTSGVNILASNPANSVLMEFDQSSIFTNVSSDVVFDAGSYSRASLVTVLPADLELGPHTLVMTASDMFGNVGRDTLNFELEAASTAAMRDATVFPNPTPGPCRLIVDVSMGMDLQWDIYTVSGRRIRTIRDSFAAGAAILDWDGRDGEGDEIANGVYLYVLRGKVEGDSYGFQETGQLVIMR